jgi:hypothetical protein
MEIALLILGLSFILLPLFVLSLQMTRRPPEAKVYHIVMVRDKQPVVNTNNVVKFKPLAKVIPIGAKKEKGK